MKKSKITKNVSSKGRQLRNEPSALVDYGIEPDELLHPTLKPLSETRTKAGYDGFHSSYVKQILVFDDGSELYRYPDGHEIVLRPSQGYMINGKLLTVTELDRRQLMVTYDDEDGETMRLDLPEDPGESSDSLERVWAARKDITTLKINYATNQSEINEGYAKLEKLNLEEHSINARRSVCEQLYTLHFARKPLHTLFTLGSSRLRKARSSDSVKHRVISLEKATEMICNEHEAANFKGRRIDRCEKLLSRYEIKDRPEYSPEDLNNNVSQLVAKRKNKLK